MADFRPARAFHRASQLASLAGLSVVALLVVGCQQQGAMVTELPSPNFSGPIAVAPPPRPIVVPPPVLPRTVKPLPPKVAQVAPQGWIPQVSPRTWKAIVIHHSATPAGGAAKFDREHREKGWDELGYDFVIGNGTDTGDGVIEIGSRWTKQKVGAHAKTADNWFNEHGIGICLVGNFDVDRPTPAQMRSLARLVSFMMKQYRIGPDQIIGHGDTKSTDCPGRHLSVAEVRRQASAVLARAGEPLENTARTASTELLLDTAK